LARITNLLEGDSVSHLMTIMGEYRPDLADPLWLFVQDPNTLYYPISTDPCKGLDTPRRNRKWELRTGIGGVASTGRFNLVLTIANAEAHQFIVGTLLNGCKTGNYPGFAVLPPGTTELQRISVNRLPAQDSQESYGPAPTLPDAVLPGKIAVDEIGQGGQVNAEEIVTGTISDAGNLHVWALVYTYYGRWFPQSFEPCKGIHSIVDDEKWKAKIILGNDKDQGKPFDIAIIVADASASDFFAGKQKEWCLNGGKYPGLLTIDLPTGITQKVGLRVIRK
jgi:hypothetical protein